MKHYTVVPHGLLEAVYKSQYIRFINQFNYDIFGGNTIIFIFKVINVFQLHKSSFLFRSGFHVH